MCASSKNLFQIQIILVTIPTRTYNFKVKKISSSLKEDSCLPKEFCFICFNASSLKMMKNAFYFILKALFIVKMFKFLSSLFNHAKKQLDWKYNVNFKIYDVTTWLTNNYNTHIAQYLSISQILIVFTS